MSFLKSKWFLAISSILLLSLFSVGVYSWNQSQNNKNQPSSSFVDINSANQKNIAVTSFYPLYDFTKSVSGDLVLVENLVPAGTEPHEYEPTPRQIQNILNADLFIYNGAGIESWVDKLKPDLNSSKVSVLEISSEFNLLDSAGGDDHDHKGEKSESEKKETVVKDPHIWLDPVYASRQVDLILAQLSSINPENKTQYEQNATNYKNKLADLNTRYATELTSCKLDEIVTSHNAFQYLAKRYNFKVHAIAGLSPEQEPGVASLAELTEEVKEKGIKHVFFETLTSPKTAQTLATETNTATLVLNPLEGLTEKEINEGKNYISVMEENLENLKIGLQCN